MKQITAIVLFSCVFSSAFAQQEISRDANGSKVIKGFISKQELATDTAFAWFASGQKSYTADTNIVQVFAANKDSVNIIVFGGTWCDDTKQILPQFYSLTNAASFPEDRVTLLGVDRSKKTVQHLSEAFNITNVPTFIVMKNGREAGRVVEYGKTGNPLKELSEIVSSGK